MQIRAKISGILYDRGGKPGSNYPDWNQSRNFGTGSRVRGSDYKSMLGNKKRIMPNLKYNLKKKQCA